MKNRLTIGEISSLFNLNVQTLHYYESIGLFLPVGRDKNGYRYYQFDQVYKLASILYLKKIGYSLSKIKECLDSRDLDHTLSRMRAQAEEVRKQWRELQMIETVIRRKISFTEKQLRSLDISSITRKEFPCRFYIPIGTEELLYRSDHFYLYPTIVFYRGRDKQFGAMLNDITADELELMKPKRIEEGEFYCGYHNGPYDLVTDTFDRIRHQAENEGIRLTEEALNINIIDQFIESDSDKYITEIQFRII